MDRPCYLASEEARRLASVSLPSSRAARAAGAKLVRGLRSAAAAIESSAGARAA